MVNIDFDENISSLYIDYFFKLIPPLDFERKINSHFSIEGNDPSDLEIELLVLDYSNLRDIDTSREIIIRLFKDIKCMYKRSLLHFSDLYNMKSLDIITLSGILTMISDSELLDISYEFGGFYSEFLRLGLLPDYVNRFEKLLKETSEKIRSEKK